MAKTNFSELNNTIRYVMFNVFSKSYLDEDNYAALYADAQEKCARLDPEVTIRGFYDVSGLRADADYMIWWHAPRIEQLQEAYRSWRRDTLIGRSSTPVWSAAAIHRPAEFNKSHIPAFLRAEPAGDYICVYPFVRSYEWYLLPDEQRRTMLAEHGIAARDFMQVRANTVSSFALGDYEWVLAFEAPQLHDIVDLMRHLRATEARRHVREEVPFYTGVRVSLEHVCRI